MKPTAVPDLPQPKHLYIPFDGETTKDGKWIVTSCRCLGCCGLAPAITINGEVYGKLKPEDIDKILDSFVD